LASLGHPCIFQRVSRLGRVTAWHSSIGHQPNFAVLNRGRHLYSAGRPSRWALAHISSFENVAVFFSLFRQQSSLELYEKVDENLKFSQLLSDFCHVFSDQ